MAASAVTACCRSSADMGAVLGSRTTTDGVRRFTADMPVTTRNPSAGNEVVRSAATDSTALAEGAIGIAHCHADESVPMHCLS